MKTVDVTFQNLDSSEISLTDVSHYFDSDPTKLVAGLRGDGKSPNAFIADTTTANAQVGSEDPTSIQHASQRQRDLSRLVYGLSGPSLRLKSLSLADT